MLYQTVEYTEENQAYYEKLVNSMFSDYEQSLLWQCMNDKTCSNLHKDLSKVVSRHLSEHVPVELYRGISKTTLYQIQDLAVGETFELNRVTSFSSDFATARQFAGTYCYGTRVIFSLRNVVKAFNYQEHMMNILLAAPESEFMYNESYANNDERGDKLDMVNGEDEWMLPIGTRLRIVNIEDVQNDPLTPAYVMYHLEIVSI
ncbi:ADP-rybosylase [Serratia phage X20]|uniref:NAD--protein ADP-ribosyltransferase modB n=1 Tax=Serratia phage X20 TaxID=2006942 RepID=A0A1Z1LYT2_9CAUD|nr:RNA polymerase ADP-ribosylase [Serratia phage X20]ARW57991.1 ADP-rybosylase [Serratia phage X20]